MNRIYRLIRNAAGYPVPAPETPQGHGKTPAAKRAAAPLAALATLAALSLGGAAHALPTGAQISAEAGAIAHSGATLTVTQWRTGMNVETAVAPVKIRSSFDRLGTNRFLHPHPVAAVPEAPLTAGASPPTRTGAQGPSRTVVH